MIVTIFSLTQTMKSILRNPAHLQTPFTHLHNDPQAALFVFLSRFSGSNVGFFKYGSTKTRVDSGRTSSSNVRSSSMKRSRFAICRLAPFCQVKSACGFFFTRNVFQVYQINIDNVSITIGPLGRQPRLHWSPNIQYLQKLYLLLVNVNLCI